MLDLKLKLLGKKIMNVMHINKNSKMVCFCVCFGGFVFVLGFFFCLVFFFHKAELD